jgi:hypothetical protein
MVNFLSVRRQDRHYRWTSTVVAAMLAAGSLFSGAQAQSGLAALEQNATSIKLHWTPSASSQLKKYQILRNGAVVGTTVGKNGYYSDFNLLPQNNYTYKVQALNSSGSVLGETAQIATATSATNRIKTTFTMLVITYDPQMSSTVPAKYSNDPVAVQHYATYFAGKKASQLTGDVEHQHAKDLEPDCCKGEINSCFYWNLENFVNMRNNNFLKYLKSFFRTASLNSFNFEIYNNAPIVLNVYPPALDPVYQQSDLTVFEFAYNPQPCATLGCPWHYGQSFRIQYDLHNHGSIDYNKLVSTPMPGLQGNSIIDLIEAGTIDGVWLIGGPVMSGYKENALLAKENFGFEIAAYPECSRDFFVTGMGASPQAFDGYAHMFEGMLNERSARNPVNWNSNYCYTVYDSPDNPSITTDMCMNLVGRFFMTDGYNYKMGGGYVTCRASAGNGNCGDSHFPPTSVFGLGDYQYNNTAVMQNYVAVCSDDWFSYPNLPTTPQKRMINGYDYGAFNNYYLGADANSSSSYSMQCNSMMYHQWWFNHIPHNEGVTNGKLNNWWPYIFDINNFKGEAITYTVTGFPVIPTSFPLVNGEIGTDNDATNWAYWYSWNETGKSAQVVSVAKSSNSANVRSGSYAIQVTVDEVNDSYDVGRNDLYYPITKNARWNLSSMQTLNLSLKFLTNPGIVASAGSTNPIIRLYKNGGTRIEYVPIVSGMFANSLSSITADSWVDLSIPLAGGSSWKKVVIGYVDPNLTGEARAAALRNLEASILAEVNYVEISIAASPTASQTTFSYIVDNLAPSSAPLATPLPGRIEAENYRAGGEGVGYHDLTAGNSGNEYRSDNVDIQPTSDAGGGYNVGWIDQGEWLEYNVNVAVNGSYKLTARMASVNPGTKTATVTLDGNSTPVAVFNLTSSSGWQSWNDIVVNNVSLSAGPHTLRITMTTGGFNLNYLDVAINPIQLPGRLQAEDYKIGGEGVGYHDLTTGNSGAEYRADNVDIQGTADAGGGYNVGWIDQGEWLEYNVNVAVNGSYKLTARMASVNPGTKTASVTLDGNSTPVAVFNLTSSSGWQSWNDIVVNNVALCAGPHTLRITMTTGGFNLNYLEATLVNMLVNGDFSCGMNNWQNTVLAPAAAAYTNDAGTAKVAITAAGNNPWDLQLYQVVSLTVGKTYTLEFDIKCEATPKNFKVVVEHNGDPWTKYHEQQYSITAAANTYQHFTISWNQSASDASVKIAYYFGTFNVKDCWIDNVKLVSN